MRILGFMVVVVTVSFGCGLNNFAGADQTEQIRAAITKAIPAIEKGAAGSADKRKCFTCHNQALPVMALAEAKLRGFDFDQENLKRQIEHTAAHLKRGHKNYLEGRGQGGRVITAGYALWALEAGGSESNEITTAVTGFLADYQKEVGHWKQAGRRPPSSGSEFMTTYVALRGLDAFGTDKQAEKIDERKKVARKWLLETTPKDTEDRVFRLRALTYVEADDKDLKRAASELLKTQRDDGGWAQKSDMESDAYATATALVSLRRAGGVAADDPAFQRGIKFLLDNQLDDGSWHVVTRAKPFQTYYETGFPHKKDQFISIAASSWATLALLLSLPDSP
jgi:N-acyl-D-amino-acid deacylase